MDRCTACGDPLVIEIDPEDLDDIGQAGASSGSTVPDSVELQCGCHFHWQCLLDAYSMNHCPTCGQDALTRSATGQERILCNLRNEGGVQEGLDILSILKEESYLKAFPEERRCRAFLEFCAEGDVGAVLDLLNDDEDEDEGGHGEEKIQPIDVLRYQDQLGPMSSGLHQALSNDREDIVWLLLLLASNLESERFPEDIIQSAEMLGAKRGEQQGKVDIRNLKDATGRTAEALAREIGGMWDGWVSSGRLKPSL